MGFPKPVDRHEARKSLAAEFGIPPKAALVCYVGRLAPEKRPDRVIEAVAGLDGDLADARLLIAGAGPWEDRLREQAERLGIGSRTTFAGLVRDLSTVYAAADAVVLLSHTEATPRVIVEAMAAGAPVIASHVGGIPQLLGGGAFGRLVEEPDGADAANALRETLTRQFSPTAAAREHARLHFGVDAMASQVEKFYGDVMALHRGTARDARAHSA
ncbi:glycosyltransferase [Streptomyces sp. NPDC001933]|uniref:glycosyltransferase n=1 Tax=Streptomyces sp. NPDC001933 TaxID=3364626 RepID=UPI0036A97168